MMQLYGLCQFHIHSGVDREVLAQDKDTPQLRSSLPLGCLTGRFFVFSGVSDDGHSLCMILII